MKQYCRYCQHMKCNNGKNHCKVLKKNFTDDIISSCNNCIDYDYCELDAMLERQIFKIKYEQLDLFKALKGMYK